MREHSIRESAIESHICEIVKARGGKAYKWVSPGRRGVPDRICIFPGGHIVFVELKRSGLKDGRSAQQIKVGEILSSLGCTVWRIDSVSDFEDRLSEARL